jgi:Domain of unknown function (DUF5664)
VKDSGTRESFDSGMVRDTEEGKTDYTLVFDGPMFKRWAEHLTKGAVKYAPRNWMQASSKTELERFKRSFLRHAVAYLNGDVDEDHAAAMVFNINGMEYVKDQLAQRGCDKLVGRPRVNAFGTKVWNYSPCSLPEGHDGFHKPIRP